MFVKVHERKTGRHFIHYKILRRAFIQNVNIYILISDELMNYKYILKSNVGTLKQGFYQIKLQNRPVASIGLSLTIMLEIPDFILNLKKHITISQLTPSPKERQCLNKIQYPPESAYFS